MLRSLIAIALLISMCFASPAGADSDLRSADEPAAQPVLLPQTTAQWRERIRSLTPGKTTEQVAEVIGRAPDTLRKTAPGQYRMDYYYYVGNIKQPQSLILHFTDGVYTRAQW